MARQVQGPGLRADVSLRQRHTDKGKERERLRRNPRPSRPKKLAGSRRPDPNESASERIWGPHGVWPGGLTLEDLKQRMTDVERQDFARVFLRGLVRRCNCDLCRAVDESRVRA